MSVIQQIVTKVQRDQAESFEQKMQADAAERAKLRAVQKSGMSMDELLESYLGEASQTNSSTPVLEVPRTKKKEAASEQQGPAIRGNIPPPPSTTGTDS